MGTASSRRRRAYTAGLRNILTVAAFVLAGLIVLAFLLYLASGTPLGVLPVAGILWIVMAPVPAFVASRNGRSFFGYLILSLVISPVLGLAVVAALGKPGYLRTRARYRPHEMVIPL